MELPERLKKIEMTRKIKILVDAHVFDHSYQGTATYIFGLYNSLVEKNHLEITLCGENISNLKKIFVNDKFCFIELPNGSRFKRLLKTNPSIIKEGRFDFVHFQYVLPLIKLKSSGNSTKYINTIHDLLFLDFNEIAALLCHVLFCSVRKQ